MRLGFLIPLLIVILLLIPIVNAQNLVITQPSANETRLAEMRDFYVYGIFNGTVTNPGDVRIEVYPGDFVTGIPVRVVQSHVDPRTGITNESVIDSSYPNGSRWGGAMVPDLIKSPGGILDPTNKVVVTSRYYLGLIQGGVTRDFDTSYMDGNGTLLTDLTAGNYTIEVTGLSGTCAGEKVNKTITLGLTNAVLGSFRPDSTKNALIQFGITHDRRSYFDWFPGYFYDPDNPGSMGYRADRRWIPNNGIEVVNDRSGTLIDTTTVANNTMFIYNFNSGAATYYLEMASILKYNLPDSANTTFLYYENGEPVLTYIDSGGAPQQVTSALRQFGGSSRLALTRLEVRNPDGTSYENIYDPNDTAWKWVYTNLSGTISINQGQVFTIYGVTKPIPSNVSSTSIPYKYSIDNRMSQLVCNITDTYGLLVSTSTHEVNLSRYYNHYPGSSNPYQKFNSLFEFGSEFTTLTTPGTYTVTLTGTDVSGAAVTGAISTFNVTVVPQALVISQPSANETRFAEMRDFYVYGIFPAPPLGTPGDVKIELFPASSCTGTVCTGIPLRQIQSHVDPVTGTTNQSCLDFSFVNGATVKGGYVPDIVINPDGSGYTDPNNKVVVTDRYYAGLVLGGVTKTYNTTYKNSSGTTLQDLTAGDYTILVTGISRSLNGQVVAKNITFGITNTALGTNRPPDNKNARINYAIQHNLRTYFDSFPGYFSDGGSNWSNFISRAYPNNGIEVVNDLSGTILDTIAIANNTMFMYNINSASTTYSVELAPILRYNLQDSENTTFLYYSNGEPFLTYVDTTGTSRNIASTINQFTGTNRLALTRVEVRSTPPSSYENLYDPDDTAQKTVYTDLSGGITLPQGQEFIVFGVTKPIVSTVSATSAPYWYSISNRTSRIAYTITNSSGGTVLTASHDVNLSRYYTPGSMTRYNSLFEFGSEFTSLTTPGTYQVSLFGTDVSGTVVTGTNSTFTVTVLPVASPDGGSDSSDTSNYLQAVVKNGAHAGGSVPFAFITASASTGNVMVQSVTLYPSRDIGEVQCIVLRVTPGTPFLITNRDVAGYESITMNWINPGAIDRADISFSVNKAWLTEHLLAPDDVVMLRYVDNRWSELPTKLDYSKGDAFYYVATTPGFSYFAIAGRVNLKGSSVNGPMTVAGTTGVALQKSTSTLEISSIETVVPTVILTAAPAPVPTRVVLSAQSSIKDIFFPSVGMPPLTIVVWSVVIIVLIISAFLIRRWWIHRQNPVLFKKFD